MTKKDKIKRLAIERAVADLMKVLRNRNDASQPNTSLPECNSIYTTILALAEGFPGFVSSENIGNAFNLINKIRADD